MWRTWTLTKLAVLGFSFGSALALLLGLGLYCYVWYSSRPKPWDQFALTPSWSDVKYKQGSDSRISGFILYYGLVNNTNEDYVLAKDSVSFMVMSSKRPGTLMPAPRNYITANDSVMIPARQTSAIEIAFVGPCVGPGAELLESNHTLLLYLNALEKQASPQPQDAKDARRCFEQYTQDLSGIIIFDQASRYRIDLPKPRRTSW